MSPVKGKVLLPNGTPAVGVTVSFENVERHDRATGTTNDAGEYELSTLTKGDGVLRGDYNVSVHQAGAADSSQSAPPRTFAVRYENPQTSGLKHTVTAGANTFDIQLQAR